MRLSPIIIMLIFLLVFIISDIRGDLTRGILLMLAMIGIVLAGCQAYLYDIREAIENDSSNTTA